MKKRKLHNQDRLRVFLCHSSADKPAVRDLYKRLRTDGFNPWLDEEDLLAGQDWDQQIRKAVRTSDVVIVCLSQSSTNKSGYVQKEIKFALDVADEQPEGTVFIIPIKLERCDTPVRLNTWHRVNLYDDRGYERLTKSLQTRFSDLKRDRIRAVSNSPQRSTNVSSYAEIGKNNAITVERGSRVSRIASVKWSWVAGGILATLFIIFLLEVIQFPAAVSRIVIAVVAGSLLIFFLGIVLRSTLRNRLIAVTSGVILIVLILFFSSPRTEPQFTRTMTPTPSTTATPQTSPTQQSQSIRTVEGSRWRERNPSLFGISTYVFNKQSELTVLYSSADGERLAWTGKWLQDKASLVMSYTVKEGGDSIPVEYKCVIGDKQIDCQKKPSSSTANNILEKMILLRVG